MSAPMDDKQIVAALQAWGGDRPVEIALLLNDLTGGGLSQGSIVTYFRRAFPTIPLRVLLEAGAWSRVGGTGLDDDGFDALLRPWVDRMTNRASDDTAN